MNHGLWHEHEESLLLVSREIRWFHRGDIPPRILEWFGSADGRYDTEKRTDHYDVAAANAGAGVKYRDGRFMDSKFLLSYQEDSGLPNGLGGRVEDWVKISTPISPETLPPPAQFLKVQKRIHTRRYLLEQPTSHEPSHAAGCEVEITSIRTGDIVAWSLCFESFGPPQLRESSFMTGIDGFVHDTPIDGNVALTSEQNFGYPTWIASLAIAS